jgi:hypothetical protein
MSDVPFAPSSLCTFYPLLTSPLAGALSNTAAQVGGFTGSAVDNGDGTVTFTITNDASAESYLYHGFGVVNVPNRNVGPMSTIHQTFTWTEQIKK